MITIVKEVLALLHPQIFPALRIADIISVRHRQPSVAKCLINASPSLAAATTQGMASLAFPPAEPIKGHDSSVVIIFLKADVCH